MHGPGYGLDEKEAFESEVAGLVDGVREHDCLRNLEKITIVERDIGRAKRLAVILSELFPDHTVKKTRETGSREGARVSEKLRAAGYAADAKEHVFVAMPFEDDLDDVYHYGIQRAVNAAGLLCERSDLSTFAGGILEWVRSRIRTASLVVADLTDANPNVYLEVGYMGRWCSDGLTCEER